MNSDNYDKYLGEQIDYYRARAGEYEEWFYRIGRYDRSLQSNQRWFEEVDIVRQALDSFKPRGKVLELACGTGIWTQHLIQHADQITAIDAASEVIVINQQRAHAKKIKYIQANLFEWEPDSTYDVIFFSFWLSHVPPERFETFWTMVHRALIPGGRVFFIDSKYESTSTAIDHQLPESIIATRKLNDASEFKIVKVFYETQILSHQLAELGWNCKIAETGRYFFYGIGSRLN